MSLHTRAINPAGHRLQIRLARHLRADHLVRFAVGLVLLFNIVLPVSQNPLRIAVLVVGTLAGALAMVLDPKIKLSKSYVILLLSTTTIGAFGVLHGIFNDTPGAMYVSPLYLVWPIMYTLTFAGLRASRHNPLLRRTLFGGLLIVSGLMLWYVLYELGRIPFYVPFDFGQHFNPAIPQMVFYSISSLVFLIPFTAVYCLTRAIGGKVDLVNIGIFLLSLGAAYYSGRRALILNIVLVPVIFMGWYFLRSQRALVRFVGLLGAAVIAITLLFILSPNAQTAVQNVGQNLVDHFSDEFSDSQGGGQVRSLQTAYLLESWQESPLIGHGLGQSVGYIRNDNHIWEYESQYAMMLSNLGLLGVVVYAGAALWVIFSLLSLGLRHPTYAPMCFGLAAGMLSFTFANASNPYFQAFGHLWTIFLPAMYIDAVKRDLRESSHSGASVPQAALVD